MDLLSGGPELPGPPRRRWVAVLAAVAVAGAAAVLAGRSTQGRPDPAPTRAAESPVPSAAAVTLPPSVVGVAVGTRYEYALTAECPGSGPAGCVYQLYRREQGQWFPTQLRTFPRDADTGPPSLWVAGGDLVTVLDEPDTGVVFASVDGGITVQARPVRDGEPIAAVPPDGVLDLASCAGCAHRLTVLEPTTGQLRRLATQPPLDPVRLAALGSADGAIWVVATRADAGTVTAVSTDRGRSWRVVPVPGFPVGLDNLLVAVGPAGSAYLLGSRTTPAGPGPLGALWRVDGPGGRWRRLPAGAGPLAPVSAVPVGPGLLVTDALGGSWRLRPDGAVARIPDARLAALRIGPIRVATGPAGVLLGLPTSDDVRNAVLVSTDQGASWAVEQVSG